MHINHKRPGDMLKFSSFLDGLPIGTEVVIILRIIQPHTGRKGKTARSG